MYNGKGGDMQWQWIGGENATSLSAKVSDKRRAGIYFYRGEWVLNVYDTTTWQYTPLHHSTHKKLAHAVAEAHRVAAFSKQERVS